MTKRFQLNLKSSEAKSVAEPFELLPWYPSEAAKRNFGRICRAVNLEGETTFLMGTTDRPLLVLKDAELEECTPSDFEVTIDEAKADWPNITTAAAVYGTRFRIRGQKVERAILFRHPDARHPAERYLRSGSVDADRIAKQIELLAKEVRQIGQKVCRAMALQSPDGLSDIAERLSKSADVIDRRFREAWRLSNMLPS